jgi:hypothetical protein
MNKRLKLSSDHIQTATGSGPKPGDYPPGSLESRAAARALLENRAGELAAEELELTPFQQATAEGEPISEVREMLIDFARLAEEKAAVFGHELPSAEWIRYRRRVIQVADELSEGRCSKMSLRGGPDWFDWMRQAQNKLREQGISPPETPAPRSWKSVFRKAQTAPFVDQCPSL